MRDRGRGTDRLAITAGVALAETGGHRTRLVVAKWDLDQIRWVTARDYDAARLIRPGAEPDQHQFAAYRCGPAEEYTAEDCNLITDAGWAWLMNGVAGTAVTKMASGGPGRIGLGTSATPAGYADTGLGGIGALTTANWKPLNTAPVVGAAHGDGLVLAAQFTTGEANGAAIAEFGTDLGTTATLSAAAQTAPLVTHGNATPGTKTAAQTWTATLTITWT